MDIPSISNNSPDIIATEYGFSRDDADALAVESQKRAAAAWEENRFEKSIVPVKDVNGLTILEHDEYMRPGTDMQGLGALNASFQQMGEVMPGFDKVAMLKYPHLEKINHIHHAGNSSGIVDGAAGLAKPSHGAGAGCPSTAAIAPGGAPSTDGERHPTELLDRQCAAAWGSALAGDAAAAGRSASRRQAEAPGPSGHSDGGDPGVATAPGHGTADRLHALGATAHSFPRSRGRTAGTARTPQPPGCLLRNRHRPGHRHARERADAGAGSSAVAGFHTRTLVRPDGT